MCKGLRGRTRPAPGACRLRSPCRPLRCPTQTSSRPAPAQAPLRTYQPYQFHINMLHGLQVSSAQRCRRVTLIENLSAPSSYGTRPPPASAPRQARWHEAPGIQTDTRRSVAAAHLLPHARPPSGTAAGPPAAGAGPAAAGQPALPRAQVWALHTVQRIPACLVLGLSALHLFTDPLLHKFLWHTCDARARLCT